MKSEYESGTRVRFSEDWSDGDEGVMIVCGEDEGKGRVDVTPEKTDLPLRPVETVKTYMIERI
jgi:hypothetical protein